MIEEIGKELIKQSGEVLGKIYDDGAHKSVASVGNTVSLLPRTLGVWLSKWEKWVNNGEESIRLTTQAVQEKAEKIPLEKLTEPEPYVAIPAIQQLSYCYDSKDLREMYANLLVASMNIDTKNSVHPAFVDIIKQLTPDEAKLLNYLSGRDSMPLIDVRVATPNGNYEVIVRNFTPIGEGICDNPSGIFAYLDNLERLKIINVREDNLANPDIYKPLEEHPVIMEIMNQKLTEDKSHKIKRHAFQVTSFGKEFIKVCIDS